MSLQSLCKYMQIAIHDFISNFINMFCSAFYQFLLYALLLILFNRFFDFMFTYSPCNSIYLFSVFEENKYWRGHNAVLFDEFLLVNNIYFSDIYVRMSLFNLSAITVLLLGIFLFYSFNFLYVTLFSNFLYE